jgi:2-methylcitrate dehydratase
MWSNAQRNRRSDFLDRVAAIEIGTTSRGYQMAGSDPEKWVPDTKETADHSLPYIVARAMFDGGLDNDSYAPEKLRDLRILALRKITVKVDPAFATLTINVPPSRLTATLDDGHALRASSIACWVSQDGR